MKIFPINNPAARVCMCIAFPRPSPAEKKISSQKGSIEEPEKSKERCKFKLAGKKKSKAQRDAGKRGEKTFGKGPLKVGKKITMCFRL